MAFIKKDISLPVGIAPGIFLAGRFGPLKTGSWILVHGREAVLVEMPPFEANIFNNPIRIIKNFLNKNSLKLLFITATHNHGDHIYAINTFHREFPDTPIIFHKSFMQESYKIPAGTRFITPPELAHKNTAPSVEMTYLTEDFRHSMPAPVPIHLFNSSIFSFPVSGEPLYMIHAPKHSYTDTMIIFRGTMISGDWWLGKGDPNWSSIPSQIINSSINTLINFSRKNSYRVERIFSAHADDLRYNVDFNALMQDTRP